jgi:hypothetical protein
MNKTAEQLFEEHGFIDNQWTSKFNKIRFHFG